MTKVLFLESGSGYGGSSKCLYFFLKNSKAIALKAQVLYHHYGPNIKLIQRLGIEARQYSFFSYISHLLVSDLVYVNNEIYSHRLPILLAKIFKKRCICHMRGVRPLTKSEKLLINCVDKFVAVSLFCKQNLVKEGIREDKTEIIYDGISIDESVSKPLAGKSINIGVVSRIVPGKGLDVFIKAAKTLAEKYADLKFIIFGDDPYPGKPTLHRLKAMAAELGLGGRVDFAGWKDDLVEIYGILDIVVCPSCLREALGNSVIEGMVFGCSVIVSATGAYPEMIQEGVNGLLFKSGDAHELAEKLQLLIENNNLRVLLGEKARVAVAEKFSVKDNIEKIERLINKDQSSLVETRSRPCIIRKRKHVEIDRKIQ